MEAVRSPAHGEAEKSLKLLFQIFCVSIFCQQDGFFPVPEASRMFLKAGPWAFASPQSRAFSFLTSWKASVGFYNIPFD